MKKIIFTLLCLTLVLSTVSAQKGIDFRRPYPGGGMMHMFVDSAAKNIFYSYIYPNQPFTSFNFLPEVHNISVKFYFTKTDSVQNYRYTILENDRPIVINSSINEVQIEVADIGEENVDRSITFGTFPIKDKVLTIITYNVRKPNDIYKNIFYGKPIPKAEIKAIAKRFKTDKGVDYSYFTDPKNITKLVLTEKDDELTIIKDRSNVDYLYKVLIRDKRTNKTVFESVVWKYGGYLDESRKKSPYITADKSIFKKSGDYEITIQPSIKWDNCLDCDISQSEIEKYTTRYTLSVTLEEESYTKKELFIYGFIIAATIGLIFLFILYYNKKRNKQKIAEQEQLKNTAKHQLNAVRSQLNPHFLFNALSGIQNLMNKNEIDNANKYLSKFARLTRNVLDDKELISLSQEKTLLDDYLQMEQLRFGFKYEIKVAENLDLENTEIPSMLLQPFVENAVKHGIAKKANDGKIDVVFTKQANDLVLTVSDNGTGFDTAKKSNGLGLPLSHSRIALLNSIYKENRFTLAIQPTTSGTKITLTLTDWL
ncbi:sensor histidine kinase [Pedobacter namyangjuensis]|uniref:sensor histidine kinase n=1 Tax=Pedobacter namyangjuensis TaxID=600626 RepID=UPI000DE2451B|nr:histidine kinase [Pedobacter namyangjuensis]